VVTDPSEKCQDLLRLPIRLQLRIFEELQPASNRPFLNALYSLKPNVDDLPRGITSFAALSSVLYSYTARDTSSVRAPQEQWQSNQSQEYVQLLPRGYLLSRACYMHGRTFLEPHTDQELSQMLRRGLVLDLSIAMGKRTEDLPSIQRPNSFETEQQHPALSDTRDWSEGLEMSRKRRIEADKGLIYRSRNDIRLSVVVRYVTRHPNCRARPVYFGLRAMRRLEAETSRRATRLTISGYHLPRVRARDNFYAKLEDQRARDAGFK
jgi:hypothetical protein